MRCCYPAWSPPGDNRSWGGVLLLLQLLTQRVHGDVISSMLPAVRVDANSGNGNCAMLLYVIVTETRSDHEKIAIIAHAVSM